jgi:hypothetical protein
MKTYCNYEIALTPSHRASALLAVLGWVSVQHFEISADV